MSEPDALLTSWSGERDPERARALLETLIGDYAEPLIRRVVGFKLRSDVDDVCQKTLLDLLIRLDRLKSEDHSQPVRDFEAYVARMARNACYEYFRARSPERHRLALKLRYLVTHSSRLTLWEAGHRQEICGLSTDRGREPLSDVARVRAARPPEATRLRLEQLVEAALHSAAAPVAFDALLEIVAAWSDLAEPRMESLDADPGDNAIGPPQLVDRRPNIEARLSERDYMRRLWFEICSLPLQQRRALLLNLNDTLGGDLAAFDYLGIASVRQIGEAVEMDPVVFADLWKALPLTDAHIAQTFAMTTQAVSNRRSSARERVARRMRAFERENQKNMRRG